MKQSKHQNSPERSRTTSTRRRNPSKVTNEYWLYAYPTGVEDEEDSLNSGKWLIFVNVNNVDAVWEKVERATQLGELGVAAKVSTMKYNPYASDPHTKVICVYTYDWSDEKDVMRVRDRLRQIGITGKIPYKTDEDTIEGKYASKGAKRISKYFA